MSPFCLLFQVRYKADCEKLYGRILDNHDVVSSLNAKSKQESEELWKRLYPNETYDLDSARALSEDVHAQPLQAEKCSDYDLVSAVKRQSPFFYQVSDFVLSITKNISSQACTVQKLSFLYLNAKLENQHFMLNHINRMVFSHSESDKGNQS